ncbi:MAG: glycosyltransferase family 4 protein [Bacteroidales bacterium]
MKILVLTSCYLPAIGGAETGLFELYRLLSMKHEVLMVTRHMESGESMEGELDPYYHCDRIHVKRYPRIEPKEWARSLRWLPGVPMFALAAGFYGMRFQPDLIHLHFISTCIGAWSVLRHISSAPMVVSLVGRADVLDAANPYYASRREAIERALGQAARVVHLTDYMVGDRRKDPRYVRIPYGVNFVVPTAAEVDGFRARMGISPGQQVLLCLARFENRTKRQNLLVSALGPLLRKRPNTVLLLVGEGPDREALAAQVRREGLADQVLTPGFILEKDIPACLYSGTVFVFAALAETFGIVLAQAMAAGLPIVAMNCSCIGEVVRHGECGRIVPDQDQEAMRTAVEELLDDETLRRNMGERGRERARTEFGWDSIATRHDLLFQEVVAVANYRRWEKTS